MDRQIIGYACGCGEVREAHYEPSACFGCGMRYGPGATYAVVMLRVDLSGGGVGYGVEVQWRGHWTEVARADATHGLRVLHGEGGE